MLTPEVVGLPGFFMHKTLTAGGFLQLYKIFV